MRRLLILAFFVVGTAVAFTVGRQIPVDSADEPGEVPSGSADLGGSVEPAPAAAEAVRAALLRRIARTDTYLAASLGESDSILRRWVGRDRDPLRVYYETSDVPGYTGAMARAARDAFSRWSRVGGIPVEFTTVRTDDNADVILRWVESFGMRRAGQADLVWRSDGQLRRATLTLATHTVDGHLLSTDAVFTVALHEIGHLLGLGHSDEPRDVMYPTTSVHDLTSRDRRTAMLLYSLPPGSLKGPRRD